jgi:hypothetical protein
LLKSRRDLVLFQGGDDYVNTAFCMDKHLKRANDQTSMSSNYLRKSLQKTLDKIYHFRTTTAPRMLAASIPTGLLSRSLNRFHEKVESKNSSFFTYHLRPKLEKNISRKGVRVAPKQFAIIIQGLVMTEDDFTIETLKLYKKMYPGAKLILSTWKDAPAVVVKKAKALGVIVLLNTPPANRGIANVNLQIVSTAAGMRKAAQLNYKYCLKTRTDQRLYTPDLYRRLSTILETFPLKHAVQKERLIGIALNTFKYRPYGVSDMFLFGRTEDMLLYWDVALDPRTTAVAYKTHREFSKGRMAEIYFSTTFLENVGHKLQWTLADSWNALGEHFCILDDEFVDIYWPKYERYLEHRAVSYGDDLQERLDFGFWLALHQGKIKEIPEKMLDRRF